MFGAHATASVLNGVETTYTTAAAREGRGIVPRACEEIFAAVQQRRVDCNIESEISVSYVEVFGDEVSDLLKRGARCGHSKVAAQQYVLSGAAERVVMSMQDVQEVLEIGEFCDTQFMGEGVSCDNAKKVSIDSFYLPAPVLTNFVLCCGKLFLSYASCLTYLVHPLPSQVSSRSAAPPRT